MIAQYCNAVKKAKEMRKVRGKLHIESIRFLFSFFPFKWQLACVLKAEDVKLKSSSFYVVTIMSRIYIKNFFYPQAKSRTRAYLSFIVFIFLKFDEENFALSVFRFKFIAQGNSFHSGEEILLRAKLIFKSASWNYVPFFIRKTVLMRNFISFFRSLQTQLQPNKRSSSSARKKINNFHARRKVSFAYNTDYVSCDLQIMSNALYMRMMGP